MSGIADAGGDGKAIQTAWNTRIDTIISGLFQAAYGEAMAAGGVPLADSPWAFCVSGSGARQEACPYSDLDCFVLLDDASPSRVAIFRDGALRMRTMLFAMGEDGAVDTLGVRFCHGGLNPIGLGVASSPPLIGTPATIASFIENATVADHIRQGLSESRLICGHKALHDTYLAETEAIRGKSLSAPWARPMLPGRKKLGLKLIQDAASKTIPDMSGALDIKTDIYRLPQFLLGGLAAYYGEAETNSFRIVTALERRGKLGRSSVTAFNRVLEAVARLRTTAHLGMHREADMIAPPTAPDSVNETKLEAADWLKLKICRMELEALKRLAGEFATAKQKMFQSDRNNPFANY
ncbi:MAG: DUF294 nucleotidyltransferase-like domain-containing protein [Pseudomonadota bacterium]|nr:DUF294 nucleotidyltransferase-like domain-containing protein [Pseudomonadota bacterium]